jgi:hypothetical protein
LQSDVPESHVSAVQGSPSSQSIGVPPVHVPEMQVPPQMVAVKHVPPSLVATVSQPSTASHELAVHGLPSSQLKASPAMQSPA